LLNRIVYDVQAKQIQDLLLYITKYKITGLRHKSVFIMSYLLGAFFVQDDCYYVEAKGPVLDVVDGKKIACRPEHSGFFGFSNGRLGRTEILVRPGLDFDKDECPVSVNHNQVDFARFAGEIASEGFEALTFEEFLAAFFAPSAEQLFFRQRLAFVRQQISHLTFRIALVIWRRCGRCAAERA
jgi:hypothetical protein